MSKANRARKGIQQDFQLCLEFEQQIHIDLPFAYRALRFWIDNPEIKAKRSEARFYCRSCDTTIAEYLQELGGMSAQW